MLRLSAISLLFLFLTETVGMTFLMFADWHAIRREVKHMIKSRKAEEKSMILEFNHEEFKSLTWVEKNREFIFNEKLYDVLSVKKTDGRINIKCYEDHKEASFFKKLQSKLHQKKEDAKHNGSIVLNLFKFLSNLVCQGFPSIVMGDDDVLDYQHVYVNGYTAPDPFHHSQPPEVS